MAATPKLVRKSIKSMMLHGRKEHSEMKKHLSSAAKKSVPSKKEHAASTKKHMKELHHAMYPKKKHGRM